MYRDFGSLFGIYVLTLFISGTFCVTTAGPGPQVYCYTCKSWEDDRCDDPYNKKDLTPEWCSGSCYKRVIEDAPGNIPTGIERGCLSRKVEESTCVSYSDLLQRTGTECLCPEDRCNAGQSSKPTNIFVGAVALVTTIVQLTKYL